MSRPDEPVTGRTTGRLHDDEFELDLPLVAALVELALPQHAGEPLTPLASTGSSNVLFRLGDDLLVRLPRQPGGGDTIAKEARWLPHVAPALPVAVPEVVAVCEPALGYPERWSVVRWLDGTHPGPTGRSAAPDRSPLARDLAALVGALRAVEVPSAALRDPDLRWYRGEALATRDEETRTSIDACRGIAGLDLDLDAAAAVWAEAMRLPGAAGTSPAAWYHGDLAAENLLVEDDRLVGVLDFGGLAVGDPTVDLMVAWEVLDPSARDELRRRLAVDDAAWLRGRAWALSLALMTFPYYWTTMPDRCASRVAVARAVLDDAAAGGIRV